MIKKKASLVQREVGRRMASRRDCNEKPIKETIPQSFARSSQMTAPFTQGGLYADDGSFYAFTCYARNIGLCPHMKNPRFYRGFLFV